MLRSTTALLALTAALAAPAHGAAKVPVTLKGSPASMVRQNEEARAHDYTFLRTPQQVREFVANGSLVALPGNANYAVAKTIGFPYARPETRLFVEQFAAEYHKACGSQMVVTSATRPLNRQPRNAHKLSVHPTGMAVDLRVPRQTQCLRWLENRLLAMESAGELDATHEVHPQHFHIAVFPEGFRGPPGSASLEPAGGRTARAAGSAGGATPAAARAKAAAASPRVPEESPVASALETVLGLALAAGALLLILRHSAKKADEPEDASAPTQAERDRAA
jgi:hypothetical protein